MKTEFINVNGQEIFVRLWGDESKPKLVLLHGFPEYGGAWAELASHLSDKYYCIAPDQRGFGQSSKPLSVESYRMSQLAQDIVGLMKHYSADEPVYLLGHDWGAAVAYFVAAMAPDLISKLIILNGVHPIPFQNELAKGGAQTLASQYIIWLKREGSDEELAKNGFEKLINLLCQNMDSDWFNDQKKQDYTTEWARENCLKTMVNWYRASPIKVPKMSVALETQVTIPIDPTQMRVSMPHLVVWGQNDTALLPSCRDGIYELADDVRVVELEGLDHWLHHQNPEQVAIEIDGFLK